MLIALLTFTSHKILDRIEILFYTRIFAMSSREEDAKISSELWTTCQATNFVRESGKSDPCRALHYNAHLCFDLISEWEIDQRIDQKLAESSKKINEFREHSKRSIEDESASVERDTDGSSQQHGFERLFNELINRSLSFRKSSDKQLIKASNDWNLDDQGKPLTMTAPGRHRITSGSSGGASSDTNPFGRTEVPMNQTRSSSGMRVRRESMVMKPMFLQRGESKQTAEWAERL